jgi:hypothetical protein
MLYKMFRNDSFCVNIIFCEVRIMDFPDGYVPTKWVPVVVLGMLTGLAHDGPSFFTNVRAALNKRPNDVPFSFRSPTQIELEAVGVLYACVTIWLDSGKDPDWPEIDNPMARNLLSTDPRSGETQLDILNRWKDRHPPRLSFSAQGQVSIVYEEPRYGTEGGLFGQPKGTTVPHDMAVYWFIRLLDSPGSRCLARCANPACKRFFLYRKPQGRLKKGTFCSNCKATYFSELAKSRRAREKTKLLEIASQVWNRCNGKADAVVTKMNEKLKREKPITRKWVTQNTAAIERYRAEKRSLAQAASGMQSAG